MKTLHTETRFSTKRLALALGALGALAALRELGVAGAALMRLPGDCSRRKKGARK